jgi:hypothetical protein
VTGILGAYSPEEINAIIKIVTKIVVLMFATSAGTFTRELIFPKTHSFGQNMGLTFASGFIVFGILLRFPELSLEYSFLVCVGVGFFVPVFKDWLKGKKIFKILFSVLSKTSDIASTAIEEINTELEKEELNNGNNS